MATGMSRAYYRERTLEQSVSGPHQSRSSEHGPAGQRQIHDEKAAWRDEQDGQGRQHGKPRKKPKRSVSGRVRNDEQQSEKERYAFRPTCVEADRTVRRSKIGQ